MSLENALEDFRRRFSTLRVAAAPIDVTNAFWSVDAQRYVVPRSYGALPYSRVMGYVAFGATLIEKYEKDMEGRVVRDAGAPRIRAFGADQIVMSCLCLRALRNTSFHEIANALEGTHRLQGYRRWHLRRLTAAIRNHCPHFTPKHDSFFLFAGSCEELKPRIALNALWLEQIIRLGSKALTYCSADEAALVETVFPDDVLAGHPDSLRANGYMWNRPFWEPRSTEFLSAKVIARRQLRRSDTG